VEDEDDAGDDDEEADDDDEEADDDDESDRSFTVVELDGATVDLTG